MATLGFSHSQPLLSMGNIWLLSLGAWGVGRCPLFITQNLGNLSASIWGQLATSIYPLLLPDNKGGDILGSCHL